MKLFHQISLAFGILLIVILTVIGVTFHYVLRINLISAQANSIGQLQITMTPGDKIVTAPGSVAPLPAGKTLAESAKSSGSNAVLSRQQPSLPKSSTKVSAAVPVVSTRMIDGTEVALRMPLRVIDSTEHTLLLPLLIVLCIGGIVAFLMSLVITRRLVSPLAQLRRELEKVEAHRFSEVQLIQAGGEIGDVALTVYDMARALETNDRVQKEFTQNASHELKTPLMSISGYAQGILDEVFQGEKAKKGLDIIINESNRLKKIVSEMTLLAKLDGEEGIFHSSSVSIPDIVSETIERVYPLLTQHGVRVQTQFIGSGAEKLEIRADRDKLLQAFVNVLANAVRYAKSEICIQIAVFRTHSEISIADDGEGIAESVLPYVFHRFMKGKDGDTGLGLAISRAIVERCGGRITACNLREGGANVTMNFPKSAVKEYQSNITDRDSSLQNPRYNLA